MLRANGAATSMAQTVKMPPSRSLRYMIVAPSGDHSARSGHVYPRQTAATAPETAATGRWSRTLHADLKW